MARPHGVSEREHDVLVLVAGQVEFSGPVQDAEPYFDEG